MAGDPAGIEELLDRAIEDLKHPRAGTTTAVAILLDQVAAGIAAQPSTHLTRLRNKLITVQALAGQATGFYRGIEQLDPDAVIGYSPNGLERAL